MGPSDSDASARSAAVMVTTVLAVAFSEVRAGRTLPATVVPASFHSYER